MNIELKKPALSGIIEIPKGQYAVGFNPGTSEVFLTGGGRDYKLAAKRRRSKTSSKKFSIIYYCAGGRYWSLIVIAPKFGEFIVMLELIG